LSKAGQVEPVKISAAEDDERSYSQIPLGQGNTTGDTVWNVFDGIAEGTGFGTYADSIAKTIEWLS